MIIVSEDIVRIVFFSAIFLMAISVSKITVHLVWFWYSYHVFLGRGKQTNKALDGLLKEETREKLMEDRSSNIAKLMLRMVDSLKEPVVGSAGALILLILSILNLQIEGQAMGLVWIMLALLVISLSMGAYAVMKGTAWLIANTPKLTGESALSYKPQEPDER